MDDPLPGHPREVTMVLGTPGDGLNGIWKTECQNICQQS